MCLSASRFVSPLFSHLSKSDPQMNPLDPQEPASESTLIERKTNYKIAAKRQPLKSLLQAHIPFLLEYYYKPLPHPYTSLDASKPWLIYWTSHALALLNNPLPEPLQTRADKTLLSCAADQGGFSGGPFQLAHLATTFSSCMAISPNLVNIPSLLSFFKSCKQSNGSFVMCTGGEVDVRASYCVVAVLFKLGLDQSSKYKSQVDDILHGVVEWVLQCQGYEGGFGAHPYAECHGIHSL